MVNLAHVRDISNPTAAKCCELVGNNLYYTDSTDGLVRLNIYDANDTESLAGTSFYGIASWNGSLYVTNGTSVDIYTLDLIKLGSIPLGVTGKGCWVWNHNLYVSHSAGVKVVNLYTRQITSRTTTGCLDVTINPERNIIAVATNTAYYTKFYDNADHYLTGINFVATPIKSVCFDRNLIYSLSASGLYVHTFPDLDQLELETTINSTSLANVTCVRLFNHNLFIVNNSVIHIINEYDYYNSAAVGDNLAIVDGTSSIHVGEDNLTVGGTTDTKVYLRETRDNFKYGVTRNE